MQNVLLAINLYCMAGITPALAAHHNISLLGEHVNNLAFSFIAPLGTNENGIGHVYLRV